MPITSGPSPQMEPTSSNEEVIALYGSCGTLKGMVLGFESGIVGSTDGANETQHRGRVDLEIALSFNQTFGESVDFHHAMNEFFSGCSPAMEMSMRANDCSNIFGVSNNLYFAKFFAILRYSSPQGSMVFVAIQNPASFTKIKVEASNVVDGTESWRKRKHQLSKRE